MQVDHLQSYTVGSLAMADISKHRGSQGSAHQSHQLSTTNGKCVLEHAQIPVEKTAAEEKER